MSDRSTAAAEKKGLHPRNRFRHGYDFAALIEASPALAAFVARNAWGKESIDFANPAAVTALNRALLKQAYGIDGWDIPAGYLCPPIPGRADYLHHLADLLAEDDGGAIATGAAVRVLDIGVGANCVYPLVGHAEYGWRFVGSDVDRAALACAQATLDANPAFRDAIELRLQASRSAVFKGVLAAGEAFDLSLCNPPFHASIDEASGGSERKWRNLGKAAPRGRAPVLNFGGQSGELWCPGGEAGFVGRMIAESARVPGACRWFTSLVAKAASLPAIERALRLAGVRRMRTIAMAQGQKKSRIVAWSFFDAAPRRAQRRPPGGDRA